jgi:hypothetical protein
MMQTSPFGLTPNIYPLSHLSLFSNFIDEQVENDSAQYASLQQAQSRPHVLDDETVERIVKLYTEAADLVWCYQEQLEYWHTQNPTKKQLQEINRLEQQVEQLEKCRQNILSLAQGFKGKTIDAILGKSDFELAIDLLSRNLQSPF